MYDIVVYEIDESGFRERRLEAKAYGPAEARAAIVAGGYDFREGDAVRYLGYGAFCAAPRPPFNPPRGVRVFDTDQFP